MNKNVGWMLYVLKCDAASSPYCSKHVQRKGGEQRRYIFMNLTQCFKSEPPFSIYVSCVYSWVRDSLLRHFSLLSAGWDPQVCEGLRAPDDRL